MVYGTTFAHILSILNKTDMKKMKFVVLTTFAIVTAFMLTSCDKNNDNDNKTGKATVQLMLTDAPALYDAVNIDVQEVQLHNETDGWVTVPLDNPGVYNLLEFSNGLDVLLGTVEMPDGILSQVRLVLGSENSIVVDGETFPLTIPSGSTSGLKFNVHQVLQGGYTYRFWIDFDAARSIHQTGNGAYMLKPVVRMYSEPSSGSIEGFVFPADALPLVSVTNSVDTLMAIPDSLGYFKISGISAGTYLVEFTSQLDTLPYAPQTILDVPVVNGETTSLDPITLILP